jgi:hypothetical protein
MQTPEAVACHEAAVEQGGQAKDPRVDLQADGLGAGGHVLQPDGVVAGARGEPSVRQHAQREDGRSGPSPLAKVLAGPALTAAGYDFGLWNLGGTYRA